MAELFPDPGPRVFAVPPGADFAGVVARHLRARLSLQPPEAAARVTLLLPTARMRDQIAAALIAGGPALLPRLLLIPDLPRVALPTRPPPEPALRRRLTLAALLADLAGRLPDLAPRDALPDLADSLMRLLDEMQDEGVSAARIAGLDAGGHAAHWQRMQAILSAVAPVLEAQAPQRLAVAELAGQWAAAPPPDPVIVAGSTGSRGATLDLMAAVAGLPQGALVLPGFDLHLPAELWDRLADEGPEDHPQYRHARILRRLGVAPGAVRPWPGAAAPDPARNRLVSLALRPAPVTDRWLSDGPLLPPLPMAAARMTLVEADSPRDEAQAVALILRQAVAEGRRAVLVTPDRGLARQVTAALDRWRLRPDDSAGRPLNQSAPGRFLLQVADALADRLTAEALVALLGHPLAASGGDRGQHLLAAHRLELALRRNGPPWPDAAALRAWAARAAPGDPAAGWAQWLADVLPLPVAGADDLATHVARHRALAERLAAGPGGQAAGDLWAETAGEKALALVEDLARHADAARPMTAADYRRLLAALLAEVPVRDAAAAHPDVLILGTREARSHGADIAVLGGLNEGVWPARPGPDPWLNRAMRAAAGLLLPERDIGLEAHDWQIAAAAPAVVLTRARRDAEAETVPSRWLNRLTNLMQGLPDNDGPQALAEMRARGAAWLALARAAEAPGAPVPPARRPAPCPPLERRPAQLSVTEIQTLQRDPYAIYARHVLRLQPLDPLRAAPDARLRGTVIHKALEAFVRERPADEAPAEAARRLRATALRVLQAEVPWPDARALWGARLDRALDLFLTVDAASGGETLVLEEQGRIGVIPGFDLTARPDRIDRLPDGRIRIFDYKTGAPPGDKDRRLWDKQLFLTGAMAERGAFAALGRADVAGLSYVGLGARPVEVPVDLPPGELDLVWHDLTRLIASFALRARGYAARRAPRLAAAAGDYDHLARFGEWGPADPPEPGDVG
jgi:double-strand break repair protein AddB